MPRQKAAMTYKTDSESHKQTTNLSAESPRRAITMVVIGRNEGERLRSCLVSVLRVNYPRDLFEVVYVDSASTDGSIALAEELGVRVLRLTGPTTAARARNLGLTAVSTPLVMFLDGDTVLHADFLRRTESAFDDPRVAGIFGVRKESRTGDSVYNAIFDIDWPREEGDALYFGGDALVRVSTLHLVGGYDASLIAGEEPDLCRRIRAHNFRILHVSLPMTEHDLAMHRFSQYWKRSVRTGYAYAQVSKRYWASADPLWRSQAERNWVRGGIWVLTPVLAVLLSIWLLNPLPLVVLALLLAAASWKSVRRAREQSSSWKVALAYGLHSQLQHIPLLVGQVRFHIHEQRNTSGMLIEYK